MATFFILLTIATFGVMAYFTPSLPPPESPARVKLDEKHKRNLIYLGSIGLVSLSLFVGLGIYLSIDAKRFEEEKKRKSAELDRRIEERKRRQVLERIAKGMNLPLESVRYTKDYKKIYCFWKGRWRQLNTSEFYRMEHEMEQRREAAQQRRS